MPKLVPLLKAIVWELCYRFFSSVFSFCKTKSFLNVSFTDYASGIRVPNCSKLAINRKNDNDIPICQHDAIVNFFWRCFVSFVKVSYWSKFTTFTVSELLRENQQVGVELPPPHQPPRLGLIAFDFYNNKLHYDNDPSRLF